MDTVAAITITSRPDISLICTCTQIKVVFYDNFEMFFISKSNCML